MSSKLVSLVRFAKISSYSLLLNIKVNLFMSNKSEANVFVFGNSLGGGNIGSTAILKAFSIIFGIILASKGDESYKQGFVLTYISQELNYSSII